MLIKKPYFTKEQKEIIKNSNKWHELSKSSFWKYLFLCESTPCEKRNTFLDAIIKNRIENEVI